MMIHGMMVGPWCWKNYRDYFAAQGYRCISPALRFHDMDPDAVPDPRLGTTGLREYAADLEEEIGALTEPPILLGHSMGGLLAQILAARVNPRAAVLLAPAPPAGVFTLNYTVLKSFSGAMMQWGFWRKPFRFSYNKAVYAVMHLMPVEDRKRAYKKFVYESGRAAYQIGFWFLDGTGASRVDHNKVTCPMLVIAGKRDRITPASVVRKTAAKYELAAWKQFGNHAHWMLEEPGWQDIAAYIASWLTSHSL